MAGVKVFDGHNDSVHHIRVSDDGCAFLDGGDRGHIDVPRALAGGFAGGFFAVFVAGPRRGERPRVEEGEDGSYAVPYAEAVDAEYALRGSIAMTSRLIAVEMAASGRFRIVRSAAEVKAALEDGAIACVLHFEGAEAIDPDFHVLHAFHLAGLRSIGLVWSRPNRYAFGVPFRFPHSPDTGPGLTDDGRRLVRACNDLRVLIDLSHLNEAGFWDVAGLSTAPLVASHSNAHAICPSTRNLTDRQLDAIRDSGGIVGVNFAVNMLRPDGKRGQDASLDMLADHFDYLIGRMGVDHVGFGSDFDGTTVPQDVADVAGVPKVVDALRVRGYDEEALAKLGTGNWLRVLDQTWGA